MQSSFQIPAPSLQDSIQLFWQIKRNNETVQKETIIPKGGIEIIFNFEDTDILFAKQGGRQDNIPKCFINGFNTTPFELILPGKQEFFGVLLQPTAIKKIFRTPAAVFADKCVDMMLVDKSFHWLWHSLAEKKTVGERAVEFSGWLQKRIDNSTEQEKFLNKFLLPETDSIMSVSELFKSLYYSPRHASRKLQELTGMNAEQTIQYKKYLRGVQLVHHTEMSLTEIAYDAGFSDQSHFIKTFKSFARITPGDYRNMKSYIAGHLYENVR